MTLFVEDINIGHGGRVRGEAMSYKLETNIKQYAFLPFIMKEQGFKAIFVILPVKGMAKKWAWLVPLFPE